MDESVVIKKLINEPEYLKLWHDVKSFCPLLKFDDNMDEARLMCAVDYLMDDLGFLFSILQDEKNIHRAEDNIVQYVLNLIKRSQKEITEYIATILIFFDSEEFSTDDVDSLPYTLEELDMNIDELNTLVKQGDYDRSNLIGPIVMFDIIKNHFEYFEKYKTGRNAIHKKIAEDYLEVYYKLLGRKR